MYKLIRTYHEDLERYLNEYQDYDVVGVASGNDDGPITVIMRKRVTFTTEVEITNG